MPQYSIFKKLNLSTDKYTNTNKVTTGMFNAGGGTLNASSMATASVSASNKEYFYTITQDSGSSGVKYFDISYGHLNGSGSDTSNYKNATEAIYKQFANIILDDPVNEFTFSDVSGSDSGTNENDVYILSVKTSKMKDRINTNFTVTLTGSDASGGGRTLQLTNYTGSKYPSNVGEYYKIISGSAGVPHSETGLDWNGNQKTTYGHFYPNLGTIVLSVNKLSGSIPGTSNTNASGSDAGYGTYVGFGLDPDLSVDGTADNAGKLSSCLMRGGSVSMRTEQDLNQSTYYCRLFNKEYNFSSNPTFLISGSELGDIHDKMVGDPTVYITGVGLYNEFEELIAVAKSNEPVKKNFGNEAAFLVKVDG